MKKSVLKSALCALAVVFFVMGGGIGCSSDDNGSDMVETPAENPNTPQNPDTPNPTPENPQNPTYVDGTVTTTEKAFATVAAWTFSDLGSVAIEGVNAEKALTDAASLAAATTAYTTFSAVGDNKYSLKNDVDYPASKGTLVAKIKSLGAGGVPIQYNKYEPSAKDCTQEDATAGGLQILDEAISISGVQGPFKIKINYGANSKEKTDGRYAYMVINGTRYEDSVVKNAKSLKSTGVGFSAEYAGTDTADVAIGVTIPSGEGTPYIRVYDIIISKEAMLTTTVTTTTDEDDGTVTIVTTVTDENGNVVSTKTETVDPSKEKEPDPGSGEVTKQCSSEASTPALDNSAVRPTYNNALKLGARSKLSEVDVAKIAKAVYASPGGKSTGAGTKDDPLDIASAVLKVEAGGAIVLMAGRYALSSTVTISEENNGTENAYKYILPENGAAVVLDFSAQAIGDSNRGVQLNGSYWHIYGIAVYNAGDNGMLVTGNYNIIERCVFQANQDTGLQIARRKSSLSNIADWPHDNLVLNCTAFDNKDDKTGENADGFAAKLTCGNGNVFDGCIAYANCDDGWDLYAKPATGSIGVVTIRNCVAFSNGKTSSGAQYANGDMNGFKLGGSTNQCPTPHVISNCMAFLNGKDGFTDNGNGGALQVSNCSSYANINSNFNFYRTLAGGVFKKMVSMLGGAKPAQVDKFGGKEDDKGFTAVSKIADSVYYGDKKKEVFYYVTAESEIHNGDTIGTTVSDPYTSEVLSDTAPAVDLLVDAKCRNADGTINMGGFLETKSDGSYSGLGARFGSEAYEVLDITLVTN
ncbi:MAG: right-handed parallel beta-helix repeat-containing protein [Treponema sp.]|nr:right-handed parallel beta-helix repeat-containing protein [Treponema sp.]